MHIIEDKFSQIFKFMGIPSEGFRMDASFINDFEFQEFQFRFLIFYLESYFRIHIRESDYAELDTIGNTMNFVKKKLKGIERLKISRRKIRMTDTLKSVTKTMHHPRNKSFGFSNLSFQPIALNAIIYGGEIKYSLNTVPVPIDMTL